MLIAELTARIRQEIATTGPISFARFMQRALYEPELGYYARPQDSAQPTGKRGDFITSVSVGACFGQLLAEQIAEAWQHMGSPTEFHVVEQGANDGQLMADVLAGLEMRHPACYDSVQPHFIEPLESARETQRKRVPGAKHHFQNAETLGECGVFFCNELLDAFPVQRWRWDGTRWQELGVVLDAAENLTETLLEADSAALQLPHNLPPGYTTETSPSVQPWLEAVSTLFQRGLWMIVDYGLPADVYYEPERTEGTLRGYRNHQMVTKDFLDQPGTMDLTTHVSWTAVTEAAEALELRAHGPVAQMRFLTALAEPLLKDMELTGITEANRSWLRQFQTLTNPQQMGLKFQAMLCTKALQPGSLRGCKYGQL